MEVEFSPVLNFQEVRISSIGHHDGGLLHPIWAHISLCLFSLFGSIMPSLSQARCRDFDEENCSRGGFCNFMHVKPVPLCLVRSLEEDAEMDRRREEDQRRDKERDERRSRKRSKRRKREDRDSRKRSRKSSRRSRSDSRSDESGDDDDGDDRSYDD